MAHFAEIDSNNKVIRVLAGCNIDVDAHGGDQSDTAAEQFATVVPLSENGIKWIQTSYNNNFRGNFAGENFEWDEVNNIFWPLQPYDSWTKDVDSAQWVCPVTQPVWTEEESLAAHCIRWDEPNLRWVKETTFIDENGEFTRWVWDPNTSSYGAGVKYS
tara:strand:+ start:84 stop:560 length:477 start_codon:yes stop_codon:yes gene_type:complete